jgi:hypothetical protein
MVSSIGPRGEAPIESPTSIIHDATAFDHWRCAGALTLNLRFDKNSVKGEDGLPLTGKVEAFYGYWQLLKQQA